MANIVCWATEFANVVPDEKAESGFVVYDYRLADMDKSLKEVIGFYRGLKNGWLETYPEGKVLFWLKQWGESKAAPLCSRVGCFGREYLIFSEFGTVVWVRCDKCGHEQPIVWETENGKVVDVMHGVRWLIK